MIKVWISEVELINNKFNSVSVWIKLNGLDVKYWSVVGLSKIGSLLGKLIMVDDNI